MFIQLARAWGGALPVEGGLMEQPLGLLLGGQTLARYEEAWHTERQCERDGTPVPGDIRELVAKMRALSALAAQRGE